MVQSQNASSLPIFLRRIILFNDSCHPYATARNFLRVPRLWYVRVGSDDPMPKHSSFQYEVLFRTNVQESSSPPEQYPRSAEASHPPASAGTRRTCP